VTATRGGERGRAAFFGLLHEPPAFFQVEREHDPDDLPEPIGTVVALLLESPRLPHLRPVVAASGSVASSVGAARKPSVPPTVPTIANIQVARASTPDKPRPAIARESPRNDPTIADVVKDAPGLHALIVISRVDGLACASWSRGAEVDIEAWSAFLAQVEHAAKLCLDLDLTTDDGAAITWENGRNVLVLHSLDSDRAVAFVFDRSVTLGYARLQIRKLLPQLAPLRGR
jgi:predicted regulator of Ras-like GTPase activity (Roadblock/LC7/MglB family)